jgi:hypothetical protein
MLSAGVLLPGLSFGTASGSAARGKDCGDQLALLAPVPAVGSTLRDSLRAAVVHSLRTRSVATALPASVEDVSTFAAAFLMDRCFEAGETYGIARLQAGAVPSTAAIDEYASGDLSDAIRALNAGDPARNLADALLGDAAGSTPLVDFAMGTIAEPGVLGNDPASRMPRDFWHTNSVASGVRVLCLAEELSGPRFGPDTPTVSIGVAVRLVDGTRATVQIAIAKHLGSDRLAVVGYWRFSPCGESVPDGLNLSY